jgi:hypothetical protein
MYGLHLPNGDSLPIPYLFLGGDDTFEFIGGCS